MYRFRNKQKKKCFVRKKESHDFTISFDKMKKPFSLRFSLVLKSK